MIAKSSVQLQITEKALRVNSEIHVCFIDLEKAFHKIKKADVQKGLQNKDINKNMIDCIKSLYEADITFGKNKKLVERYLDRISVTFEVVEQISLLQPIHENSGFKHNFHR